MTVRGELPVRCWGGDYVVYNPLSGNTHIFDIVTGEVLKEIIAGDASSEKLYQHVADFLDLPNDARVAQDVGEILTVLDELGLIEPAGGC
jgi:PqqD family protein of HPr-rel-A system